MATSSGPLRLGNSATTTFVRSALWRFTSTPAGRRRVQAQPHPPGALGARLARQGREERPGAGTAAGGQRDGGAHTSGLRVPEQQRRVAAPQTIQVEDRECAPTGPGCPVFAEVLVELVARFVVLEPVVLPVQTPARRRPGPATRRRAHLRRRRARPPHRRAARRRCRASIPHGPHGWREGLDRAVGARAHPDAEVHLAGPEQEADRVARLHRQMQAVDLAAGHPSASSPAPAQRRRPSGSHRARRPAAGSRSSGPRCRRSSWPARSPRRARRPRAPPPWRCGARTAGKPTLVPGGRARAGAGPPSLDALAAHAASGGDETAQ